MNLLDDIEIPKQPSRASLTKKATNLVGRRKTRRGKKKKPTHILVNKRLREKELKKYKSQSKERWEQYQEFRRLIS